MKPLISPLASHSIRAGDAPKDAHKPGENNELPSAFCPRCSARLEQRKCKMICHGCGYYMSCS